MNNRTVLVTGGGQGIGFSIAERFAESGDNVLITGRNRDKLEVALGQFGPSRSSIDFFVADATSDSERRRSVEYALERFGSLDVLVNNSGSADPWGPLASASLKDFESCFASNVFAGFAYALEARKAWMAEHGGVITNVASISGLQKASGYYAAYAVAKAATIKLTEELAYEWGPEIVVNAVAPGYVKTAIVPPGMISEDTLLEFASQRVGETRDVAEAVYFLSSPQASWTTGSCLAIGQHTPHWPPANHSAEGSVS